MTRFARAKGSKASNEKAPEPATSWSEMKQELLDKNKELEEKRNHEKAMQQRQANYQAFLQEKEEEDVKNVSWANFPDDQNSGKNQTIANMSQKRKFQFDDEGRTEVKSLKSSVMNKKVENGGANMENSDEEFSALKLQIDKVLDSQPINDSDSDAPPEVASIREKPQEIIVKKAKKVKQKLQILVKQEDKSDKGRVKNNSQVKATEVEVKKVKPKKEDLNDNEKKKIEKKQERYIKQLEKKKLKRQEQKSKNSETMDNNAIRDDDETKADINIVAKEQSSQNLSEIEAKIKEKKLERRKKQKEKKLKKRQEAGLINGLEEKQNKEVLTEKDLAIIQKKKDRRARQADKRKAFREAKALAAQNAEASKEHNSEATGAYNGNHSNFQNNDNYNIDRKNKFPDKVVGDKGKTDSMNLKCEDQNHLNTQRKRKLKTKDNRDVERKKTKSETMFINGNTIEIDYVDGFPVKKDDSDRLKKLRKEMISRGLPRSEINISLKLERRRAEKALAKEKKNVCFNCRKSGHNLSECPELDKDQVAQTSGTGICYKCGSTEHTHYECKVVKGLDYKFATCFICKEQGHISRQCPDNQRGLYPKGGSCNVCGDVTHLKKDCPKHQAQQAQLKNSFSIETMDNRNPDDLGAQGDSKNSLGPVKKLNKIRF